MAEQNMTPVQTIVCPACHRKLTFVNYILRGGVRVDAAERLGKAQTAWEAVEYHCPYCNIELPKKMLQTPNVPLFRLTPKAIEKAQKRLTMFKSLTYPLGYDRILTEMAKQPNRTWSLVALKDMLGLEYDTALWRDLKGMKDRGLIEVTENDILH